ncbi:hypothetical protein R80B4_00973 [Fibrobacteres bacterium R8-0-B4]
MGAGAEIFRIVGTVSFDGMTDSLKKLDKLAQKGNDVVKGFAKFAKELDNIGLKLSRAFTVPLAAATAAVGALAVKTGSYADNLLGLEQSTGLATDTLQEFAHVATTAGGSSEALFSSLTALTGKLPDIAAGTGDASKAFHELGVNVLNADGSYRSMENILPEVISRLQGIDDITKRNVLAHDIFGKKTKEVAAILGMSAAEMAKVRQEAHNLGLVTSREGLESANKFRIGVENLKGQMAALGREIAVSLMPVLNETLIPLIQTKVIPTLQWLGDMVRDVAGFFADLPHWVQTASIAAGAFLGMAGPLFLMLGKAVAMAKNSLVAILPLWGALKTAVLGAGAAVQGFAASLGIAAGSLVAVAAALAGAIALFVMAEQKKKEALKMDEETKQIKEATDLLHKQTVANKKYAEDIIAYKKAEAAAGRELSEAGQKSYDILIEQYEDSLVRMKEHATMVNQNRKLTADEIEQTRQRARANLGLQEVIKKTEWEAAQEAAAAAERAKRSAAEAERRKNELAALLKTHTDAYNKMGKSEMDLIEIEQNAALSEARSRGATVEETLIIYKRYNAMRRELIDKETEDEARASQELLDKKAAIEKDWTDKVLRQSGDRLKILAAERAEDLAKAAEAGADTANIDAYYAQEEIRIAEDAAKARDEINAAWKDKLMQQSNDRAAMLEAAYAADVAAAKEAGADIAAVEAYYAEERERLEQDLTAKKIALMKSAASAGASAINQLGSVMAAFSAKMTLSRCGTTTSRIRLPGWLASR